MEDIQQKTKDARLDAYKDGMENFTMLRYTAALESLNSTIQATLQDGDIAGVLSDDCVSHTAATLAAADMLGSKLTALDKSIQNLSLLVGRSLSK
jgi:hypothetical protein